jgi:hypothetical protein
MQASLEVTAQIVGEGHEIQVAARLEGSDDGTKDSAYR